MFYLAPHPKLDRPRHGSPQMFTVPWVEKYLSRVRPWHVVAIWGPFTIYLLVRASATQDAPAIAGWAALGVFSWTLLEYLLHRFVFHFEAQPDSELQRDASFLIHGIHHDYPWDRDRLVMPRQPLQGDTEIVMRIGGPCVERNRSPEISDRVLHLPALLATRAQMQQRRDMSGLDRECSLEARDRLLLPQPLRRSGHRETDWGG